MERRRGERSSNAIFTFASFSLLILPVSSFPLELFFVICDPLTIDSLHLHSHPGQGEQCCLRSHWLTWKASWAALTQSGLLEWVWQASTQAPSIFYCPLIPLKLVLPQTDLIDTALKDQDCNDESGLRPNCRMSDESPPERKRMLCPCFPACPAWPTTRKQTKCTDETLPLKISFNLWPCNKGCWTDFLEFRLLNIRNKKGIKMP